MKILIVDSMIKRWRMHKVNIKSIPILVIISDEIIFQVINKILIQIKFNREAS